MEQIGLVVKKNKTTIEVSVQRMSQCGHNCSDCSGGCDTSSLRLEIEDTLNANVGDRIVLYTSDKKIIKQAYITYAIPMFFLILGILIGMVVFKNEGIAIILSILCIGISYFALRLYDNYFKKRNEKIVKAIRIHE